MTSHHSRSQQLLVAGHLAGPSRDGADANASFEWGFQALYLHRISQGQQRNAAVSRNPYTMLISKSMFESTTATGKYDGAEGGPSAAGELTTPLQHASHVAAPQLQLKSPDTRTNDDDDTVNGLVPHRIFKGCVMVAANGSNCLMLHVSGDVYQWQFRSSVVPSISGEEVSTSRVPTLVHALAWERALRGIRIVSVACGPEHCLALTDGPSFDVYSWGRGDNGRLGHGGDRSEVNPRLIAALIPYRVIAVTAGNAHSAAITMGSVGLEQVEQAEASVTSDPRALAAAALNRHRACKSGDQALGAVWTWGCGRYGALGHGEQKDASEPKRVQGLVRIPSRALSNSSYSWTSPSNDASSVVRDDMSEVSTDSRQVNTNDTGSVLGGGAGGGIRRGGTAGNAAFSRRFGNGAPSGSNSSKSGPRADSDPYEACRLGLVVDGEPVNQHLHALRRAFTMSSGGGGGGDGGARAATSSVRYERACVTSVACGDQCTGVVTADGDVWVWGRSTEGQSGIDTKVLSRAAVQAMQSGKAPAVVDGNLLRPHRVPFPQLQYHLDVLAVMRAAVATERSLHPLCRMVCCPWTLDHSMLRAATAAADGSKGTSTPPLTSATTSSHLPDEHEIAAAIGSDAQPDGGGSGADLRTPGPLLSSSTSAAPPAATATGARGKLDAWRSKGDVVVASITTSGTSQPSRSQIPQVNGGSLSSSDSNSSGGSMDPFYWATGMRRAGLGLVVDGAAGGDGVRACCITAGQGHFVVGTRDGSVWSWGLNGDGQVGMGRLNTEIRRPAQLPLHLYVQAYLESTEQQQQQRFNSDGSAGSSSPTPTTPSAALAAVDPVVSVYAGSHHSVAVCLSGLMVAWGRNAEGQLGTGSTSQYSQPDIVQLSSIGTQDASGADTLHAGTSGMRIMSVACGSTFTTVLAKPASAVKGRKSHKSEHHDPSSSTASSTAVTAAAGGAGSSSSTASSRTVTAVTATSTESSHESTATDSTGEPASLDSAAASSNHASNTSAAGGSSATGGGDGAVTTEASASSSSGTGAGSARLPPIRESRSLSRTSSASSLHDTASSIGDAGSFSARSTFNAFRSPGGHGQPQLRKGLSMAYGHGRGQHHSSLSHSLSQGSLPPATPTGHDASQAVFRDSLTRGGVPTYHHHQQQQLLSDSVTMPMLHQADLRSSRRVVDEMRLQGLADEWSTTLGSMAGSWTAFMMTDARLQGLWRQGIPPQLRCYVWPLAVGNALRITPAVFDMCRLQAADLLKRLSTVSATSDSNVTPSDPVPAVGSTATGSSAVAAVCSSCNAGIKVHSPRPLIGRESSITLIPMDLLRTFSPLCLFGPPGSHSAGPFYECVLDVLQAFCVFRPELGYVQGMSYIAAMAALHVSGTAVWASRVSADTMPGGGYSGSNNGGYSFGSSPAPAGNGTAAGGSTPAADGASTPGVNNTSMLSSPSKRYSAVVGAYGGVVATPPALSPMANSVGGVAGTFTSSFNFTAASSGGPAPWASPVVPSIPSNAVPVYTRSLAALSPSGVYPGLISRWRAGGGIPSLPLSPVPGLGHIGFASPRDAVPSSSSSSSSLPGGVGGMATPRPVLLETPTSPGAASAVGGDSTPAFRRRHGPLRSTSNAVGGGGRGGDTPRTGSSSTAASSLPPFMVVADHKYLAFQLFTNLLMKHHLYVFFVMDPAGLAPYYTLFNAMLAHRLPAVSAALAEHGIDTQLFLLPWLQTVFLKSLPLHIALRIMDVMMLDGVLHLFKTAVAIMELLSPYITAADAGMEEVIDLVTGSCRFEASQRAWADITNPDLLFKQIEAVLLPGDAVVELTDLVEDAFFFRHVSER